MAYDQGAAYEPPRRAYYGQQQQAPVQPGYSNQAQQQYSKYDQGSGQIYDQYQREHGQGYGVPQQNGQPNGYSYEQGQNMAQKPSHEQPSQEQDYSDGYYGGYQQSPPTQRDRERQPQPQSQEPQERTYDARYQQRSGRATPQGYAQHPGHVAQQQQQQPVAQQQRMPPPRQPLPPQQPPNQHIAQQQRVPREPQQEPNIVQRQRIPREPQQVPVPQQQPPRPDYQQPGQPGRQGYQVQPSNDTRQRPDPRHGYPPANQDQRQQYPAPAPAHAQPQAAPQNKRQTFEQQSADLVSPPRVQGTGIAPKPTPPPPPQKQEPKKPTMDEWKAMEKARLHKDAQSPDYMPQDNAFPIFPSKKKERLGPEDRSGGTASVMSQRSSAEHVRSSTSSVPRPVEQYQQQPQKPGMARGDSYKREVPQPNGNLAPQSRPSMDHKPYSFEPIQDRQGQSDSPQQQQRLQPPQERPAYDTRPSDQRQTPVSSVPVNHLQQQSQQERPAYERRPSDPRHTPVNSIPVNHPQQRPQQPMLGQQQREELRSPPPQASSQRQPPVQAQNPPQNQAQLLRDNYCSPLPEANNQRQPPPVQAPDPQNQGYLQQSSSVLPQGQPPREDYRSPPPQTNNQRRPPPVQSPGPRQDQGYPQQYAPVLPQGQPPREDYRSPPPQVINPRQPPAQVSDQRQNQGQSRQNDHRSPPSKAIDPRHPPPVRSPEPRQNQGYPRKQQAVPLQPQLARPGTAGGRPPMQVIDTSQAARQPGATYMDHQPLSPGQVPPRPSTAQGGPARSPSGPQVTSPLSQYSYSHTPGGYDGEQVSAPSKPFAQQAQSKHESLGDFYDGYRDVEPVPPVKSRDSEIELEMPDFDSAAPQQTSLLHKRNQTVDRHLAEPPVAAAPASAMPVMPTQRSDASMQPLNNPKARGYQQQPDPYRDIAAQKHRHASPAPGPPAAAGFDFGVPQQQQQQEPQQFQYDQAYQRPPSRHDPSYRQRAPPVQPSQSGYANEQPPRRSMDDARQMPYRAGGPPQPQRFHPNGQPIRGPLPPQQRPEVDRNFSGQTVQTMWSDPGQQRVGSAPPVQQGLREPPGRPPYGAPLTQQRSAPEQPQVRHSNPDALPQHPVPVRPGLVEGGAPQPAKPPPVRTYDTASISSASSHVRQASIVAAQPVTHAELEQLRAAVSANPNNNKQALIFAKKLVEAAAVLASEGGRADAKTTAKNREKYITEAYKRIKKLASSGYPEAQFYLADCHGQGSLGLEVDTKEAFNLYQAAAKQGHPQAAYRTAVCCEMGPEEGGGTRKDFAKAVQWYRRAAALSDVAAMYKLGIILLKGLLGQPRNVGEAVTWLKRAAERSDKDNPHALHELGTLYESTNTNAELRGKIIADDAYARDLFQQAAALGYKFSQFRLGQAYEYGALGLPIDNRASISWYSKAAAQGEHQAELALSGWYLTGAEGILEHSDTEAYLWARKAAASEPPLPKAMFAMGYFAEQGIGCPVSVEEARKWYGRAASYRFPKALERLEELKRTGKTRAVNGKLTRNQKKDEAECAVM
ncbi:hypothetical protein LTR85_000318 [Meristemomyces frigidus]|nr:hypothetical protein LTR85_000318 [Meristemomyces frigidus]